MSRTWTTCDVSMKYVSSRLQSSTGCQRVKHGPRTILLKLLTILLSGSPYQWWTRQQVTAGLIPQQSQLRRLTSHAQHLSKAISVLIVELAGTNQFQMFATVNTKKFPRGISDQVISCVMTKRRLTSGRAPDPGLKPQAPSYKASSRKRQAASPKLQASSSKPQATSSLILDPS